MSRRIIASALVAALVLAPACEWESRHTTGVLVGGAAGAGLGALVGAAVGSTLWGLAIGAAGGALAGYFIADSSTPSQPKAGYQGTYESTETNRKRTEADREFRLAMQSNDAASSEFHLKKSVEILPTPAAYNNLGLLALQSGDRSRARLNFNQAIELDHRYKPALENLQKLGPP